MADKATPYRLGSTMDSAISIQPDQQVPLTLKLREYEYREIGQPRVFQLDEGSLVVHGFQRLHNLFKRVTLDIVLELSKNNNRDTQTHPIPPGEVAWYFRRQTDYDVSGAVHGPGAVPFVYDPATQWYTPDFGHPPEEPSNLGELFVGAYGVIRAYAAKRRDVLHGGTGLAIIPRPSGYYGDPRE